MYREKILADEPQQTGFLFYLIYTSKVVHVVPWALWSKLTSWFRYNTIYKSDIALSKVVLIYAFRDAQCKNCLQYLYFSINKIMYTTLPFYFSYLIYSVHTMKHWLADWKRFTSPNAMYVSQAECKKLKSMCFKHSI